MTEDTEVIKEEKTKRQLLKAILVCLFVVSIILGVSFGIAAYLNQHQAQLIQDNETSPTPTPTTSPAPTSTAPSATVLTPTATPMPVATPM